MNVLVVEDDAPYAKMLAMSLERAESGTRVAHVQSLEQACVGIRDMDYDVVLLDLGLPDSNGLATVRRIQDANDRVPIVVLSGRDDDELAREAVRLGAEDYIVKGEQSREGIVRALQYAIARHRNAGELRFLASHDPLTGLANRAHFLHELGQMIAAAEQSGRGFGVFSVDLDRFRGINALLGYRGGDELLRDSARRLDETLKRGDVAARIDADQYAVIVGAVADEHAAERAAERIHQAFAVPARIGDTTHSVTVSIGVALYPTDGRTAEVLLAMADSALHQAKESGRNRTHFHDEESTRRLRRRREVRADLEAAIRGRELEVRYQPRFDRSTRMIHSVTALPFWQHRSDDAVGPDAFYPDAEHAGLVERIEEYVVERVAAQIERWTDSYDGLPSFSLPVSPGFLRVPEFADYLESILLNHSIRPAQLELAVAEPVLSEGSMEAIATIHKLHDLGLRIAIVCDGGSCASLRQMASLPLDSIQLSSALVGEMSRLGTTAIIKALIVFAHERGFSVAADGIATEEVFDALRELRCDILQGSYLMRPLPPDDLEGLLRLERAPTPFDAH